MELPDFIIPNELAISIVVTADDLDEAKKDKVYAAHHREELDNLVRAALRRWVTEIARKQLEIKS